MNSLFLGTTRALEFLWRRWIQFFPARPPADRLANQSSICIGSKSLAIGDVLVLTTLPRLLKSAYPKLRVFSYPKGFNPYAFLHNPYVDRLTALPGVVYGDDCNWGSGQLIQLKEQFFDLPVSKSPRPEIYLSEQEKEAHLAYVGNIPRDRPICVLHSTGKTYGNVLDHAVWEEVVQRWKDKIHFWQVGIEGQDPIAGCQVHALTPKGFETCRPLFALIENADFFIGVNSGPMHIATAFSKPSLIMTVEGKIDEIFRNRERGPYFLYGNHVNGFLYSQNQHVAVNEISRSELHQAVGEFLASRV